MPVEKLRSAQRPPISGPWAKSGRRRPRVWLFGKPFHWGNKHVRRCWPSQRCRWCLWTAPARCGQTEFKKWINHRMWFLQCTFDHCQIVVSLPILIFESRTIHFQLFIHTYRKQTGNIRPCFCATFADAKNRWNECCGRNRKNRYTFPITISNAWFNKKRN